MRLHQLAIFVAGAIAQNGLILHYPLTETSGTVANDASGNGNHGALVGSPQLTGSAGISLDGVDDHIMLPDNIMSGLSSMTISLQALIRSEQSGNYFIFGLGSSTDGVGDGYVFATGNPYRAAISPGNWEGEAEARASDDLPRDVWKTLTYVVDGTSEMALYLDGVHVAGLTNGNTIVEPGSIGGGATDENYIGRSQYEADNFFAGSVRDFRIYNTALSAAEIEALIPGDEEKINAALAGLTVTNVNDVRGNLHLPTSWDDVSVSWDSNIPSVISVDGIVNRQSSTVYVTLTATLTLGDLTREKSFAATVREAFQLDTMEGYMFSYFTGNSLEGEKIYFAASEGNNALQWMELNGGQPRLESNLGTGGLRDPFIIRSPEGDTFYLIATDLSIGSGTSWGDSVRVGSRYLEVWESHDLINWSDQRHVLVSPPTAGNTWAPEAFYDSDLGSFIVFWASSLYEETDTGHTGSTYHRMLYVETRDFVTFGPPQVWQDAGMSRIDTTVLRKGDTYYRFTKDEGASGTGCTDIIQEISTELRGPMSAWTILDSCIGRDAGTSAVEGPTAFGANDGDANGGGKYYLFVDEYGDRGYIPLETADLDNPNWQVSGSYSLPSSPRHGTVIPVTAAELAGVRTNLKVRDVMTGGRVGNVGANEKRDVEGEILRYDFQSTTEEGIVADISGNGQDATIFGGAALKDGEAVFDGVDGYVRLPDDVLAGVVDVTVEAEVSIDGSQGSPYFIWGIGNTVSDAGYGYLFTTGNSYRTSIALGNWETEQTAGTGSDLARDEWVHLVYTLQGDTAMLYLDGIEVSRSTVVTNDPGEIGGGETSANYLGRSMYAGDRLFFGRMRKFAVYDRGLDASEVLFLSGNEDAVAGVTLEESSVLKVDPIIDMGENTVLFAVVPGTDVSQLSPVFSTSEGISSSPSSGDVVDLSSPVSYALYSNGEPTAIWTMSAVEMRSPILPGLYADPNIAIFNNKYYIFATTDGYAGWGGNIFYVWSSTNLIDWTRADKPFLTLDGDSGNVPWATGNAWAPTIIDRNGKFYFYFSGHNPTYDRKTIGVAVADAPEGPYTAEAEAMILNNEAVTSGQAIDPAAFRDPVDGKYYIFWGNGSPVYAELGDDMVSLKSDTIEALSGLVDFREGLFVVYRQGVYHLTYSIDDTGSENYRVGYATSTSVHGPWTYQGVVLEKDATQGILGTGHNSMVQIPGTDEWYIVYHRFQIPGGGGTNRETTIDQMTFDSETGLMEKVVPTLGSVEVRVLGQTTARVRGKAWP